MFNNLKNKTSFQISKPTKYILLAAFVFNLVFILLSVYLNSWRYNLEFIKSNLFQLIIILAVFLGMFYYSYQSVMKKRPDFGMLAMCIILFGIMVYLLSGLNIIFEQLMYKLNFSKGNILFIYFGLIISTLILSNYDFPIIDSLKKFFLAFKENIYKNLGLLFVLALVVSYAGFIDVTYIYVLSMFVMLGNLYMFKAILGNLRK